MSTDKHDQIMARTVPVTVSELADLAHEANALQADVVNQADAVRYLRDSLRSSNDARAVLVDELHKLDDELRSERSAFGVMEQTALTLRDQLATETAKHARATQHIARMVTGQGWPEGRSNVWHQELLADRALHEAERARLRAEVARLTEGLASAHAAQGIVPLRFDVGTTVELVEAHNNGVVGGLYSISETKPNSSLPYYLGGDAEWVPESAVKAAMLDEPADEPADEPRPFKVGDRVEHMTKGRGVIALDDGDPIDETPFLVKYDEEGWDNGMGGWFSATEKLTRIEWEAGERIEVGTEVEYVGNMTGELIGKRVEVLELDSPTNVVVREHGNPVADKWGVMPSSLRRIS